MASPPHRRAHCDGGSQVSSPHSSLHDDNDVFSDNDYSDADINSVHEANDLNDLSNLNDNDFNELPLDDYEETVSKYINENYGAPPKDQNLAPTSI